MAQARKPHEVPADTEKETHKERLDRELIELLQEMRVMLPGIEVIFGFLLTVPFTNRFSSLSALQRGVFFGVFLTTGLATVLLVAPSAYHRLRWRQKDKEKLLQVANKLAIAGLVFFALSMLGITFIVTDMITSPATATWVASSRRVDSWAVLVRYAHVSPGTTGGVDPGRTSISKH